jgi:hypothetical protein
MYPTIPYQNPYIISPIQKEQQLKQDVNNEIILNINFVVLYLLNRGEIASKNHCNGVNLVTTNDKHNVLIILIIIIFCFYFF